MMNVLNDSSSVCSKERVYSQHQAAMTLLQNRLKKPSVDDFHWIDIACGQGQILTNLENILGADLRKKVTFHAFDVDKDSLKVAIELANSLAFNKVKDKVGQIEDFHPLMGEHKFDFITLTNSIHEFEPYGIPAVFIDLLSHLRPDGLLYVFDMEQLTSPELGAIAWNRTEITKILCDIFKHLSVKDYVPEASDWPLSSIRAWSVQIDMVHISKGISITTESRAEAIRATKGLIESLLKKKLELCAKTLKALKENRPDSAAEKLIRDNAVFDFWALNDVIGGQK